MKDNTTYYIRHDSGRRSVVFMGTFDYLKRVTFQNYLQRIKEQSHRPFFWPQNIQSLVRTLNYGTLVLNQMADFYTLTTKEMADKHHWDIVSQED